MTIPTAAAVPSTSPVDLLFNAEKLDQAVNTSVLSYADRFGVERMTLAGAVSSIAAVNPRGAWTTATLYNRRDLVSNAGTWYIALDTHTSGASFAGDQSAHWRVHQGVLATDLSSSASAVLGAGMVGHGANVNYGVGTLGRRVNEFIRVEDYGAVGDGVTNDQAAIAAAITAAAGRRVYFRAGKTYLVGSALSFSNIDVDLCGDGSDLPIIKQAAQAFDLLTCDATVATAAKTLSASVTINSRGWPVASTAGVTPGMLMEVRSSASWYHDPRPGTTDTRKSELHRVVHIEGGFIYSEAGAFDGYDTSTETVTLNFYNPISVNVKDVLFQAVRPAAGIGVATVTGLTIKRAHNARIENACVENHLAAGISLQGCYRSSVLGGYSDTSNAEATGYGVSVNGSTFTHVHGRRFAQCRRGVDVTGSIVCRHTLIEACVATGGGENSEGTTYGWEVAAAATAAVQYGFGSHGGADYTVYRGNVTHSMHTPIFCRGRNEYIEGNTFIGRSRFGVIQLGFGENFYIRYNHAFGGYTGSGKADTIYDGGGNIHSRRADYFIRINSTVEGLATGTIVVESNDVEVQDRFISLDSGAVPANLTVKNNRVRFQTISSTLPCYLVYNEGTSTVFSTWSLLDNDYQRTGGATTGRVSMLGNLESRNYLTVYQHTRTHVLFLADDEAVSIPVPETGTLNQVRVIIDSTSGGAYGNVAVVAGSTSQYAIGTPVNISNFTTALTGTTGTDTDLNLSLVDGLLYVENRLGASRRVLLTILHAY